MAFQYAHHRPLTPITPVHSPHPSNTSSIRSRTPGQLSLHEYRKQQVTPSPPALQGQRSVKKKRAASSLKRSERSTAESASPELYPSFHTLSTPPLTPSLVAPVNFTSHHSLPNASATRYGPVIPEFSHLSFTPTTHQHQQKTSLGYGDAPLLDRSRSSSSFSQLLPPSPSVPPHFQESTPHFLESLLSFAHTTPQSAQGGYHALGGENWEEEERSSSRFVKFDSHSPGPGKPSRSREHTAFQAPSGLSKDFRTDLSDQKEPVGGRAPWYVLSARLPGIGKAVGNFEADQAIGLLQNEGESIFHTQNPNLFPSQDQVNTKLSERLQHFKQQDQVDVQPRERHFKSIKRLPHPESELSTRGRPSPVIFPTYRGKPLAPPASIQTSSTSTLSLSNFNFPQPPVASRSSARGKHVTFGLQADTPSRTSTPTVIQHRGASFELLNPHDSLKLSDIRTPLEIEDSDFFSGPITPLLASSTMSDTEPKSEKQKPHAQLFGTVNEAFNVIRKRSGPFRDTPDRPQTPLDDKLGRKREDPRGRWIPQSVNTDPYLGRDMTPEERKERVEFYRQQMAEAARPSSPAQLMSQATSGLSNAAGSNKGNLPSNDDGQMPVSPLGSLRGSSMFKAFRSKHEADVGEPGDDHEEEREHEADVGATDDVVLNYEESNYAPSAYAQSVFDNRFSIPFGVQVGETDYSEISALDMHRFSSVTQASAPASMDANPSTISEILHGYEHPRSSETQHVEAQVSSEVGTHADRPVNPFIDDSESSEEGDLSHLGPWGTTPLLSRTDSEARRRGIPIRRPPSPIFSHLSSEQRAKDAWYQKNGTEEEKRNWEIEKKEWHEKHALWKAEQASHHGRESDDVLSREITGLSEDILTQLSPDRETTGHDDFTSSSISRPVQAPSAPPAFGLPPLPANVNRPLGLFAGRIVTPSSSEVASQVQSYGDTRQLLDTSSSANVSSQHRPTGSYPTRADRAPVTAQDFPLESSDSEPVTEAGERSELTTPAKRLRVMNPDPSSADSKGSVQHTPPFAERGHLLSDTDSGFSGEFMSPLTRFNNRGKQSADNATGRTVEDYRVGPRTNPFTDFDSASTPTYDRRYGVSREHAFFNPDAIEGPPASRASNESHSFQGSLADVSDSEESLSNMQQTEDEIAAIMMEGGDDDWPPRNRDSQADEWTTVREPSEASLAESSSMAEYNITPPAQVYQNAAFRDGAQVSPEDTLSIPLSRAHIFGHNGHFQGSHSPREWQDQGRHNNGYAGHNAQYSSPANSTGRQVQALQKYVFIPDDMLSPEPDDSPAQFDGPPDHSYFQLSQTSSPPKYTQQQTHFEPAPPEPAYYSPTRNVQQRGRHMMDLEAQSGIEMGEIRGQRVYRQHNGSQVARASVHSQRTLQPLALQPKLHPTPHHAMGSTQQQAMGSNQSLATNNTRWSWFMKRAERFSARHPHAAKAGTNEPRDGPTSARAQPPMTAAEVRRASTMSELQQSRLPGHSITTNRRRYLAERRAAIICLVSLGWFAPFAMLLGYGWFDEYVRIISHGDVERLPRSWRVIMRRFGWAQLTCWIIVLVVVLAYNRAGLI